MSTSPNFNKTSEQLRREINQAIENAHRNLVSSQTDVDGRSRAVWSVVLALIVFFTMLIFRQFFEQRGVPAQPAKESMAKVQPGRDAKEVTMLTTHIERIEDQMDQISSIKSRVAPSMPIDVYLESAKASANDLRLILGLEKRKSSTSVSQAN